MFKRSVAVFLLLFLICFSVSKGQLNSLSERLKTLDAETNDSIALAALEELSKSTNQNIHTQLYINYRIINRANQLRRFNKAIDLGNQSLNLARQNKLDSLEAVFNKLIGVSNYYMDQRKAAIPFFEKGLVISKDKGFWELEASCLNNLGGAQSDVQLYADAEKNLLNSISIMKAHGKDDSPVTLRTYRVLARVYDESKQSEKAEPLYLSLIEKGKQNKDTAFLCDNLIFYSHLLSDQRRFEEAVLLSAQALEFRRHQKESPELLGAVTIHAINLSRMGNFKEAYDLMTEATFLTRNIFKNTLEKEIAELEVKYKTEQIQQEKELAELKTKKQKQIYWFSLFGILIFIGLGVFIWNQKRNAKQKAELATLDKLRFKEVIEAEEKERARIAQELHDGLGQLLSTARLNVASLEDSVAAEDKVDLNRSLKIIDDACVEVRSISHNLMPSALMRLGLIPAINEVVNNINSSKTLKIDFETNLNASLGHSLDITIYRVIQEILNNMIKHSKANHIIMAINKQGNNLEITMRDNGVGFDTSELNKSKGMGWKNIFSRISMLDGNIKLESELQKGTMVFINLKLKNG